MNSKQIRADLEKAAALLKGVVQDLVEIPDAYDPEPVCPKCKVETDYVIHAAFNKRADELSFYNECLSCGTTYDNQRYGY